MRDMCMNAIEMGLVYYAVTDHCECNQYMNVPHTPGGRYYDVVRQSYAELLQNQERFPNLKLLRGIELGQPLQDLNAAHDALTGRDYDVVIGSLHNIRDHDDFYFLGYAVFQNRFDQMRRHRDERQINRLLNLPQGRISF